MARKAKQPTPSGCRCSLTQPRADAARSDATDERELLGPRVMGRRPEPWEHSQTNHKPRPGAAPSSKDLHSVAKLTRRAHRGPNTYPLTEAFLCRSARSTSIRSPSRTLSADPSRPSSIAPHSRTSPWRPPVHLLACSPVPAQPPPMPQKIHPWIVKNPPAPGRISSLAQLAATPPTWWGTRPH